MPNFLIEEATVRHSGESPVLSLGEIKQHLLLTLSVTHVVERQNLDVDVLESHDGLVWSRVPTASFLQRFSCGTYEILLPKSDATCLKAVWRLTRWGRGNDRPLCRFSLSVEERIQVPATTLAMAGAA